jgi:hypothetical protein
MKKEIFIPNFKYLKGSLKKGTTAVCFNALLLFLFFVTGCHSDNKEILPLFNAYQFDQKVLEKLPVYDSLAVEIIEKFPAFKKSIDSNESYQAFRYMPGSGDTTVFKKLPPEVSAAINHYFTTLGNNFIFGFDVFKDSTIKIYIRNTSSKTAFVDVEENLSYYPDEKNIRHREFPVKDSILNEHWQYWARFNKRGLF